VGEEALSFADELLNFAMEQDAVTAQTADRMNLVRQAGQSLPSSSHFNATAAIHGFSINDDRNSLFLRHCHQLLQSLHEHPEPWFAVMSWLPLSRTVIGHCVWLYFPFSQSYREVEEMMAKRGVIWSATKRFANGLRSSESRTPNACAQGADALVTAGI
jgi:hypothetical protein